MTTNMNQAQELLFGKDGLAVSNFKLFLGSNRDATPEQVAGEINRVLNDALAGDFVVYEVDGVV